MSDQQTTQYTKGADGKSLIVNRSFYAPPETVWRAWTEAELLDQWWGPKPFRAETKSMDFREGGTWLYSMVGPAGTVGWSRADFTLIRPRQRFESITGFCDEHGERAAGTPKGVWQVEFAPDGEGTKVTVTLNYENEAHMAKMLEMGFQEGFATGHRQLDALLETMAA